MRPILIFSLVTLAFLQVEGTHLILGQISGEQVLDERIEYNPFPFKKRVKNYFYTQPDNRKIQGIQALDNLHSQASMNVTAGGVGHPFVNLRMKSERGRGLDYSLGIYVEPFKYQ